MKGTTRRIVRYDVDLIAADMAKRSWNNTAMARAAGVSNMAVGRFLSGEVQTAPMAGKLAAALGHHVSRYVIEPTRSAVAS